MNIFLLKPLEKNKNKELWSQSGYKGNIIVRASDEVSARQYVANFMHQDAEPDQPVQKSPWLEKAFTSCSLFEGDIYKNEGQMGILHPASLRDA